MHACCEMAFYLLLLMVQLPYLIAPCQASQATTNSTTWK
jgi:hypothetical protein